MGSLPVDAAARRALVEFAELRTRARQEAAGSRLRVHRDHGHVAAEAPRERLDAPSQVEPIHHLGKLPDRDVLPQQRLKDLLELRDYFTAMLDIATKAIAAGRPIDEVMKTAAIPGFEGYEGTPTALQAAYEELTTKE